VGINRSKSTIYVTEGNSGTTPASALVELSRPSDQQVTVDYRVGSTYVNSDGADYQYATGTLVFAPGQTQASIPITIYGDTTYEADDFVGVGLTGATNAVVAKDGPTSSTITISIRNDDAAPAVTVGINRSKSTIYVTEGNSGTTSASALVELSRPSDQQVTVDYIVGSPYVNSDGADYLYATGTLVFAPGQTQASIPITIYGDTIYERDDFVGVGLGGATNAVVAKDGPTSSTITIYIRNDDIPYVANL